MSAYVTYERRADAEQACRALHANLNIKGSRVRVMWARKRTRAAAPPGTAAAAEQPEVIKYPFSKHAAQQSSL